MPPPHPAKIAELPLARKQVAVLAQAPIDQSPRMVAQAWMLAETGASVQFIAFGDADGFPLNHPRIRVHAIGGAGRDTAARSGWPLLRGAVRTLGTVRVLSRALRAATHEADLLLAQIPPAVPGIWLGAQQDLPLVLDWHNLSAPMAALKLGPRHPAVSLLERIETRLGRKASLHFAVTDSLAVHLERRLRQRVGVLPDRPWREATGTGAFPLPPPGDGRIWRTVVSPTSWSRDEAMELLLDAAEHIRLPPGRGLHLVATGKGPLRAAFEARAAAMQRPGLRIETAWLSPAEYRALLAGADAGISLHRSASGLDFPMKIVDMEAAGLPVLALDYGPALQAGLAGLAGAATFTDAASLAARLERLLATDSVSRPAPRPGDWPACWSRVALPALLELLP